MPPGCKDCEVDRIVALNKGGRDDPSNMQWLPREQHQDKTRRERGSRARGRWEHCSDQPYAD
jgi:hypothetical protein